jgi:hypothetical protein
MVNSPRYALEASGAAGGVISLSLIDVKTMRFASQRLGAVHRASWPGWKFTVFSPPQLQEALPVLITRSRSPPVFHEAINCFPVRAKVSDSISFIEGPSLNPVQCDRVTVSNQATDVDNHFLLGAGLMPSHYYRSIDLCTKHHRSK